MWVVVVAVCDRYAGGGWEWYVCWGGGRGWPQEKGSVVCEPLCCMSCVREGKAPTLQLAPCQCIAARTMSMCSRSSSVSSENCGRKKWTRVGAPCTPTQPHTRRCAPSPPPLTFACPQATICTQTTAAPPTFPKECYRAHFPIDLLPSLRQPLFSNWQGLALQQGTCGTAACKRRQPTPSLSLSPETRTQRSWLVAETRWCCCPGDHGQPVWYP